MPSKTSELTVTTERKVQGKKPLPTVSPTGTINLPTTLRPPEQRIRLKDTGTYVGTVPLNVPLGPYAPKLARMIHRANYENSLKNLQAEE